MSHIFIAYDRKDIDYAQKIVNTLAKNDLDTWADWKGIPAGESWAQQIYRSIEEADAFLFLISPDSVRSNMCNDEIEYALRNGKRIIPILIRETDVKDLPRGISEIQWINGREGQDDFDKVISETIKTIHTDYAWLNFHTELQARALKWERQGRDESFLLRGRELQDAEQWAAVNRGELTVVEYEFLQASDERDRRGLLGLFGGRRRRQFEIEQTKSGPTEQQTVSQTEEQEIQPVEVGKLFSVSTDQSSGVDKLNYSRFSDAFATLVQNPEAKTPITIGIYGQWGSGKSFLMKKIIKSLKGEQSERPKELWKRFLYFLQKLFRKKDNPVDTIIIEFNAWVYSGSEHLWASLVTHLYGEIEKYFGVRAHYHRLKKALQRSLPRTLGVFAFYTVLGFIASFVIDYNNIQTVWDETRIAVTTVSASVIGGSVLASLPVLWSALRDFADTLFLSRAMNLQKLAAKPDFRDQIGIMADIKAEIGFISHLLESRNKKRQTRIVLFIDDLDRCEHQKAVEVLQAIMLLLADRDGSPFVIFLGIDARVMVRAVEEHYGDVLVKAGINGYEYLDKIVQVPFVIPSASRKDIGNYVDSLIWTKAEKELYRSKFSPKAEESETEKEKSLVDEEKDGTPSDTEKGKTPSALKEEELPTVQTESVPVTFTKPEREAIESCVDDIADNPRKIKRIINIYRLVRLLLPQNFEEYQKIIRWILLTEQWPLHASWIIEEIENDFFLRGKLSKKKNATILDVYDQVKDNIYADDMDSLMTIDAEPILFNQYIQKSPIFTVKEINDLLYPLTFNLNPAIKSEISKYTAKMAENYIQTKSNRKTRSKRTTVKSQATKSASVKKAIKTKSEAVSEAKK